MTKWRYRFSLRSVVAALLLATAGTGLWSRWDPWVLDKDFSTDDAKGWRRTVSPDGAKVVALSGRDYSLVVIHENRSHGRELAEFRARKGQMRFAVFSPDGSRVLTVSSVHAPDYALTRRILEKDARIWRRRRPEYWWGVLWLWEFWLTFAFAVLLAWSLYRDRKHFKSLAAKQADL